MIPRHLRRSPRFAALLAVGTLLAVGLLYLQLRERPPAVSTARPPTAGNPPALFAPLRRSPGHGAFDQARCLADSGRERTSTASVHRWVDAQGVVHYSDRPPANTNARDYRVQSARDAQPVSLAIDARGAEWPPDAVARASADADAIGRLFRDVLRLDTTGGLQLRVRVVDGAAALDDDVPAPPDGAGAYLPEQRLIVVRLQEDADRTRAVLRHLLGHALIHEWIGHLPTALNEGLAEYVEAFEVRGRRAHVDPRRYATRIRYPEAVATDALEQLLSMSNVDFHEHHHDANYGRALALVSTMMATPPRRAAFGALLRQQRAQACIPIPAVALLRADWPDGFDGLADLWQAQQNGEGQDLHTY